MTETAPAPRPMLYDATAALKDERKRVVRHCQRYTSEQRANLAASHRAGHRQKQAVGEYFYTHPDVPRVAFDTRQRAALAGFRAQQRAISDAVSATVERVSA